MKAVMIAILLVLSGYIIPMDGQNADDDWLLHARISTPYGYNLSWEEGVERAVNNGVNVILDWANFSDTYQGRILHFNESLEEFRQRAEYIHSHYPGVKYMVYFAPMEMGTPDSDMNMDGKDDDGKNSTYTDHPEWLQVGIDGRKAVFYGSMPGMPFWVGERDEDVWLSPSNREYRNIIMGEAREIAKAGADAVWFDVPHLCFDFGDNWQNQWPTVDEASRNDFYNDTGLILPPPPLQPDWNNETWLKFVEWRYKQMLDFVDDFNKALKEGNPNCKLAIETSSHTLFITQHGCDTARLPYVCDVIGHEYTGPFYKTQYYTWLVMLATLKQWYDFDRAAEKEASWLLSYVKQGDVSLANFHAALLSAMGFNYYTSGNIGMAGIVDEQFMHDYFVWVNNYDEYLYGWEDDANVGVIFSRHTLDYLDRGSWEGYGYHDAFPGVLMMLLESNIPFRVLSENDLDYLSDFEMIILPDFACMNESQAEKIREYVAGGGKIVAINETSLYTQYGSKRKDFLLSDVFGVNYSNVQHEEIYENNYGNGKAVFTMTPLGRYFYWAAQPWSNYSHKNEAESIREEFLNMIEKAGYTSPYHIGENAIAISYKKGNQKMLRILNFNGIKWRNAEPEPQQMEIRVKEEVNNVKLLEFMDGWRNAEVKKEGDYSIISFTLHTQATLLYSINESTLYAKIMRPQEGKLYLMDRDVMSISSNKAIIIGKITLQAETNGDRVEFYIDNELKYEDNEAPYSWLWNEFALGGYEIKIIVHGNGETAEDKVDVLIFNLA